ncbi:MAG TPA: EAL domain-containing protein [Vicinamibacterales bacterium]
MTPLRLLLIDDSEDDAALVVRELARAGYAVSSQRVDSPEALAAALRSQRWDLAIADYVMPRFNGVAALALLREHNAELPLIFVSGTIAEAEVVVAMRTGAQDYVRKGDLARLVPTVERQLREAAGRLPRPHVAAQLVRLAYHDALTDLPNRVLLHDRLRQAILASQRTRKPLAVMVLEIGGLDAIVDAHGRYVGDRVIQHVATRLRALLREGDTVASLGAQQFAVMLPGTDAAGAGLTARKVLQEVGRPLVLDQHSLSVAVSVGIVSVPDHGTNPDELLRRAERALRAAQQRQCGSAVYAADGDRDEADQLLTIPELREGVEHGQFVCDYQPIVHVESGRVIGVEALARWNHPRRGRLLPAEFIELAETTWLIEPLTMLLLDRAVADWANTDRLAWAPVAVNLSSKSLRDPNLPDLIADLLRLHGAPAAALTLELADDALVLEMPKAEATLTRLHRMGVFLAIDDFNAEYSHASYLRRVPIDRLKIGRSFVARLQEREAAVRSVIDLAHSRGLVIVAEGVETAEMRDHLRALGCDAAQGNFIAPPASLTDTRRWVARSNATRLDSAGL